jgi:cytoskeleton protein RodZ
MGAAHLSTDTTSPESDDHRESLSVAPDVIEVRRHSGVAAGVGVTASVVAIAYLARAAQTGGLLDWTLALVMGCLSAYWLAGFVDARTPLFIADDQGVRLRLGRSWQGLTWSAVHHVEHTPRRGLLRDGRLVVVPHNPELVAAGLSGGARRQARLARLLHGAPLAVPLGLATRVVGDGGDLSEALERVVRERSQVVVVEPAAAPEAADADVDAADHVDVSAPVEPALVASETPSPLRDSTSGRRSEVRRSVHEDELADEAPLSEGRELRRPGSVSLVEETQSWGDRVRPIARAGEPVAPIVLDDFEVEPAEDPIIGPEIAAARTRLGLSVDELADRTRIRPHVLESIEVDDFVPCGGDFYARGHLRTLARVLGLDVAPMLESYDDRYAHAPINPRRVFEAELATGFNGSIRGTRGGPNWSVLVAVVMALVLCWSVARLVMETPPELRNATPVLNGSGGPDGAGSAPLADPVPVVVTAVDGGARVVVRDGGGEVVFAGNLAAGASKTVKASPPVRVQSSDGAVTVAIDGAKARPVGEPGVSGQGTFVAP